MEVYRLYHDSGALFLSVPSKSTNPCPPHALFSRVSRLIPEIHSHVDIMGQKAIDKVQIAAEQVEKTMFEELARNHKQWKRANVDERTLGLDDKGGDSLVYTSPCKHQGLSRKFTECFLVVQRDILLIYHNKDGYFNNRTPEKIVCVSEVVLKGSLRDKRLVIKTALHQHKLEFESVDALEECTKAINEACNGHNNAIDVIAMIKRVKQLNETERTMQEQQRGMQKAAAA